jgi:urease accessory protein
VIAASGCRPLPLVGRHARLELVFGCCDGRTVLEYSYAEPPLRVGRCFADGAGLHLILASSAPGIFNGDVFDQHIVVKRGACVRLTSQSALQAHPGLVESAATVRTRYDVEDDGRLQTHWDPLIPFAHARLEQRVEVRLGERARLHWSDAWMVGREGRGERWRFDSMSLELKVSRADIVEYLERFSIVPGERSHAARWTASDACYFGTTLRSGEAVDRTAIERLHEALNQSGQIRGAADVLSDRLALVRLMSRSGPPFHRARKRIDLTLQGADGVAPEGARN